MSILHVGRHLPQNARKPRTPYSLRHILRVPDCWAPSKEAQIHIYIYIYIAINIGIGRFWQAKRQHAHCFKASLTRSAPDRHTCILFQEARRCYHASHNIVATQPLLHDFIGEPTLQFLELLSPNLGTSELYFYTFSIFLQTGLSAVAFPTSSWRSYALLLDDRTHLSTGPFFETPM